MNLKEVLRKETDTKKDLKTIKILVICIIILLIIGIFLIEGPTLAKITVKIGSIKNPNVLGEYKTAYLITNFLNKIAIVISSILAVLATIYALIRLFLSKNKITAKFIELIKTILFIALIAIVLFSTQYVAEIIMGVHFESCWCGYDYHEVINNQ